MVKGKHAAFRKVQHSRSRSESFDNQSPSSFNRPFDPLLLVQRLELHILKESYYQRRIDIVASNSRNAAPRAEPPGELAHLLHRSVSFHNQGNAHYTQSPQGGERNSVGASQSRLHSPVNPAYASYLPPSPTLARKPKDKDRPRKSKSLAHILELRRAHPSKEQLEARARPTERNLLDSIPSHRNLGHDIDDIFDIRRPWSTVQDDIPEDPVTGDFDADNLLPPEPRTSLDRPDWAQQDVHEEGFKISSIQDRNMQRNGHAGSKTNASGRIAESLSARLQPRRSLKLKPKPSDLMQREKGTRTPKPGLVSPKERVSQPISPLGSPIDTITEVKDHKQRESTVSNTQQSHTNETALDDVTPISNPQSQHRSARSQSRPSSFHPKTLQRGEAAPLRTRRASTPSSNPPKPSTATAAATPTLTPADPSIAAISAPAAPLSPAPAPNAPSTTHPPRPPFTPRHRAHLHRKSTSLSSPPTTTGAHTFFSPTVLSPTQPQSSRARPIPIPRYNPSPYRLPSDTNPSPHVIARRQMGPGESFPQSQSREREHETGECDEVETALPAIPEGEKDGSGMRGREGEMARGKGKGVRGRVGWLWCG
ncbi:hypothetical protein M501DRAFT_1050222 [Patellaria atrata CBS 101060]|uniref:Uncharacterized protein n=1 Tax=Patellaria atrata CBS 101060 TaxID=1346257 RepID=A0A9P4SBM5_9PEZI|nr:hypothetical protein M501DRAFT_1050222 [Patellaria atrata CBS 101060]